MQLQQRNSLNYPGTKKTYGFLYVGYRKVHVVVVATY